MKRIGICLVICLVLVFSNAYFAFAEEEVVESPDLKIEVDCKLGTYSSVPIIVNGSTLLPLREILINIGVQNDDGHIIWNASERSVTVFKDSTKVKLFVNDVKAYVNDTEITLSAPPVIYKDKTYIPARFVSQSMGKEVGWDGIAKKVFIKDRAEYNRVKEILDKAYVATNNIEKYKISQNMNFLISQSGVNVSSKLNANVLLDLKKRVGYYSGEVSLVTPGVSANKKTNIESYFENNISYNKNPDTAKWEKTVTAVEEAGKSIDPYSFLSGNTLLYTALSVDTAAKTDEIVLKGNVCIGDLIQQTFTSAKINDYIINQSEVRISINKNTNIINEFTFKVSGTTTSLKNNPGWTFEIIQKNSDVNGNFEITRPKDIE